MSKIGKLVSKIGKRIAAEKKRKLFEHIGADLLSFVVFSKALSEL